MKGALFKMKALSLNSMPFILHPSYFILALDPCSSPQQLCYRVIQFSRQNEIQRDINQ